VRGITDRTKVEHAAARAGNRFGSFALQVEAVAVTLVVVSVTSETFKRTLLHPQEAVNTTHASETLPFMANR